MKKYVFLLIILGASLPLHSQEGRHAVKLNLIPLVIKTVSLQYEYSITSKKSFLCQGGYTFPTYLLEHYYDRYKSFGSRKVIFKELKFNGGFQFSPEYRYYFRDKQNSGLYIGAYLRYLRYAVISKVAYTDVNFNVNFIFTGLFTSTNLGLVTGYQWRLGNHFLIDWWILSAHAGANRFRLRTQDDFSIVDKPTFVQDLQNTIKDIPLLRNFGSDIADKDIKVGFGYSFFGTRLGLCLGYRF